MSDNPYAPPRADLGTEAPGLGVAGRGDFEIGQCISDAWASTWSNFGLWLGVGVVWTIAALVAALTGIGLLLAVPVLFWGIVYFFLRMHDGTAEFRDAFAGFSRYGRALGTMLALFIVLMLISLVGQSVQIAGDVTGTTWLSLVGAFVNLVFAFLVTARLNFSYFLAVDRQLPALEAIRTSWDQTGPVKWKVAGLLALSMVFSLLGVLALIVGIIPAMVFVALLWVSAHRQLFGGPASA